MYTITNNDCTYIIVYVTSDPGAKGGLISVGDVHYKKRGSYMLFTIPGQMGDLRLLVMYTITNKGRTDIIHDPGTNGGLIYIGHVHYNKQVSY